MGADIVIAVHLALPRLDPKAPLSSVAVLQRSANVSIAVNELRSMEDADILLKADVERFTTIDYNLYDKLEAEGYKAAQTKSALLTRLRVSEDECRCPSSWRSPAPKGTSLRGFNTNWPTWRDTRSIRINWTKR